MNRLAAGTGIGRDPPVTGNQSGRVVAIPLKGAVRRSWVAASNGNWCQILIANRRFARTIMANNAPAPVAFLKLIVRRFDAFDP